LVADDKAEIASKIHRASTNDVTNNASSVHFADIEFWVVFGVKVEADNEDRDYDLKGPEDEKSLKIGDCLNSSI